MAFKTYFLNKYADPAEFVNQRNNVLNFNYKAEKTAIIYRHSDVSIWG